MRKPSTWLAARRLLLVAGLATAIGTVLIIGVMVAIVLGSQYTCTWRTLRLTKGSSMHAVTERLGIPGRVMSAQDYQREFPFPGWESDGTKPQGEVWIYYHHCFSDTYAAVYFDKGKRVYHVFVGGQGEIPERESNSAPAAGRPRAGR